MSLRINTNVDALNAYNNLSNNQTTLSSAFQKLSSGLRINKAADDAAGLSIAQGLTSQINGLTQAVSNTQDAINVAQIADGALGTVQNILQRERTLVVQAGNIGTNDYNSLNAIQSEIKNLGTQLDNIASQTKFGQTNLLDGKYAKDFQVGANGGDVINLDLTAALGASGVSASGLGLNSAALKITSAAYTSANVSAWTSATTSADLASIDAAITKVSTARSSIGAVQNQLNYTRANLQTGIVNVSSSRSNITDADLATEVTHLTQGQILSSAATTVLGQANSAPQSILKLLNG
jgi:flagellin